MTIDQLQLSEARWLRLHPAPIRSSELSRWEESVRAEMSDDSLVALFTLLTGHDDELAYQAMAAARALGLTVWADGQTNDVWDIRLPSGAEFRLSKRDSSDATAPGSLRAALDREYVEHPESQPTVTETALALAELDQSPVASQPDLIEREAQELHQSNPDADPIAVLARAEALAVDGEQVTSHEVD